MPAQTTRADWGNENGEPLFTNELQASPLDGNVALMFAWTSLEKTTTPPPSGTLAPGQTAAWPPAGQAGRDVGVRARHDV